MNVPPNRIQEVAVIIVNFNSGRDTIECLGSLLESDFLGYRIVICDNGSSDDSLNEIRAWLRSFSASQASMSKLAGEYRLSGKKILFEYADLSLSQCLEHQSDLPVTLIDVSRNVGFAAGNNIGLLHALKNKETRYFWLLNPDTVVTKVTLGNLRNRIASNDEIGMCGTLVKYYHAPEFIQARNGNVYNRWTGVSIGIDAGRQMCEVVLSQAEVEEMTEFVLGASMMVSRSFVETVGLMNEEYFLYFEEIDWALRSRESAFRTAFAEDAVVFHKHGGSIGSHSRDGTRSIQADYFLTRSRLKFTKNFYPALLPIHIFVSLWRATNRLFHRRFRHASAILRATFLSESAKAE